MAARWKALVLWKARGTIVLREGIVEGVASETERVATLDADADTAVVMFCDGLAVCPDIKM
jgi:hypothetical protein